MGEFEKATLSAGVTGELRVGWPLLNHESKEMVADEAGVSNVVAGSVWLDAATGERLPAIAATTSNEVTGGLKGLIFMCVSTLLGARMATPCV